MTNKTNPETALKIAANIDDADKIRELLTTAIETGDNVLERVLRTRAAALGIIASPGKSATLAKRIEDTYNALLSAQHIKVNGYTTALRAGNINTDYVLERTNHPLFMADVDSLTGDAIRNHAAAQETYDAEYTKLATISDSTDPAQALLDETRATKIWGRIERKLRATTDHLGLLVNSVTAAADGGDEKRLTLAVILTEAPDYLDANGISNADEIIREVALKASPTLLAAHEQVALAQKILSIAQHNANTIKKATSTNLLDMPNSTDKLYSYVPFSTVI